MKRVWLALLAATVVAISCNKIDSESDPETKDDTGTDTETEKGCGRFARSAKSPFDSENQCCISDGIWAQPE